MKLSCIIVEDNEIEANLLVSFIQRMETLELNGVFNSALEAQKYLRHHETDLIISDIMLPDITGLQMIKTMVNPPQVIFTTSFMDYAVDGFELEATDYIVKPVVFERFILAVNRALNKHRSIEMF